MVPECRALAPHHPSRIENGSVKKFALLAVVMACITACSCQKRLPDFGGLPIDVPGAFHCFDGGMVIKVVEGTGDKLTYSVENKNIATASATPSLQKTVPWVILPESLNSVWIFDGVQDVTLIELHKRETKFTSSQVVPELLEQAPPELLEKLPADLARKKV